MSDYQCSKTLFDINSNGVGGRVFGSAPNQIFLPAVGWRAADDGASFGAMTTGTYWSTQPLQFEFVTQSILQVGHRSVSIISSDNLAFGRSVRCVEDLGFVAAESITLNQTASLFVGGFGVMNGYVLPNHTSQNIIWSSSDPSIAYVSSYWRNGGDIGAMVVAVSAGTVIITVTIGSLSASTSVTIEPVNVSSSLDGIVIDGIRWATNNVDMPGTFAGNPWDAGMFFQWNRRIGWSSTEPLVNSDGSTVWDSSVPTGTEWYAKNDPCPIGWRVPTYAELISLNSVINAWITINGVSGRLCKIPQKIVLTQRVFSVF